jgi:hypothetical protein
VTNTVGSTVNGATGAVGSAGSAVKAPAAGVNANGKAQGSGGVSLSK